MKIQHGLNPKWSDKRDFDFIKSHKLGALGAPTTYKEFSIDAGFPMMNQNSMGLPYGCTGMTQADLCSNEDFVVYDPADVYDRTPPGGRDAGREIRKSLAVVCDKLGGVRKYLTQDKPSNPRTGYFSIRAQGMFDWFDAFYISLLSTQNEKRGISIGIPWYPEFESPLAGGILPIPIFDTAHASWHNAEIAKIKIIKGVPYLGIKSWQGPEYGDNGWCYMSRELCNVIFEIQCTEAFTVSKVVPGQTQTVDLNVVEQIVSFFMNLYENWTKKKAQTQ